MLTLITGSGNEDPFLPHAISRTDVITKRNSANESLFFITDTNLTYNTEKGLSVANKII
jgi:hypothetical protein